MRRKVVIFFLFFLFFPFLPGFAQGIRVITIDDYIISPVVQEYIKDNLRLAEINNEEALVIRINTPGGMLQPTQKIVKEILNADVPVITYVWPAGSRAASAGTFIGYASSVLAMSPSTHIGAAHPVSGQDSFGETSEQVKEKLINDTLAWAKNIARARNRPYAPLKEMTKESKSFTEKEAIEKKVADLTAQNLRELLEKINQAELLGTESLLSVQDDNLKFVELSGRQKFLNALMSPNLVYLLFTLGMLGVIFEVTNPGFGFPGIAGLICLIISFYAFSVLPINYAGIALIALGLIFLIAEALTPSFGLFGGAGIVSFILGSLFMFRGPAEFTVHLGVILPLAVLIGAWNIFILGKIVQARIKQPQTGKEGLIGKIGTAQTEIKNKGKIFIHGELWEAQSNQKIKKGEKVKVVAVEGLKLTVKPEEEV